MRVLTRSLRIRKALDTVRSLIPVMDWQTIAKFLTKIEVDREWQTIGTAMRLKPVSAELLPLYSPLDFKTLIGAQIRFALPVCRLYGDQAFVGLVAHELAHAFRAAQMGDDWVNKMGSEWTPANDEKYELEEHHADAIASAWGFSTEIAVMRKERQEVLKPYLSANETRILRHVQQRNERQG